MDKIARPLFGILAIAAPSFAMNADSPEKALAWVGYGIIFALLSLMLVVAARDEK